MITIPMLLSKFTDKGNNIYLEVDFLYPSKREVLAFRYLMQNLYKSNVLIDSSILNMYYSGKNKLYGNYYWLSIHLCGNFSHFVIYRDFDNKIRFTLSKPSKYATDFSISQSSYFKLSNIGDFSLQIYKLLL